MRRVRHVLCLLLLASLCLLAAQAQAAPPRAALAHRSLLIRSARVELGLSAPVATLAAQAEQESGWNPAARSVVGAQGLAQFMPQTAAWLGGLRPDLGPAEPCNPSWALRAMAAYDAWLLDRTSAATTCEHWAMVLSAYNGGLGWVRRDALQAVADGLDPARWWGHVETVNAGRSRLAFAENRGYPRRILLRLEDTYEAAGWGKGVCP